MYDLYGLAHVAGWEPYDLLDLSSTCFRGWICLLYIKDPAQHLKTAELQHLL